MTPPSRLIASPSQTIGPFFHVAVDSDRLGCLVTGDTDGERIRLRIGVMDGDGLPVDDALVEIWQANGAGEYVSANFIGFGRLATGEDGWCVFETIRPGAVAAGEDRRQAAHINVCILARGLLRHLHTRAYFDGDSALGNDPLLALVPHDRRDTLLARRSATASDVWEFVVHLQGDGETVFFDL